MLLLLFSFYFLYSPSMFASVLIPFFILMEDLRQHLKLSVKYKQNTYMSCSVLLFVSLFLSVLFFNFEGYSLQKDNTNSELQKSLILLSHPSLGLSSTVLFNWITLNTVALICAIFLQGLAFINLDVSIRAALVRSDIMQAR